MRQTGFVRLPLAWCKQPRWKKEGLVVIRVAVDLQSNYVASPPIISRLICATTGREDTSAFPIPPALPLPTCGMAVEQMDQWAVVCVINAGKLSVQLRSAEQRNSAFALG